jgi:RHS repeat-associated protein
MERRRALQGSAHGHIDATQRDGLEHELRGVLRQRVRLEVIGLHADQTGIADAVVTGVTRAPHGALASLSLGTGQTTSYTYDYRLRMQTTVTGSVQNVTLTYDAASNITSVADAVAEESAERTMSGDQRATDLWYTGQRDEDYDGLGLYNYKARFYSSVLGRFVSADPTSDSLNRYSYVGGNPIRFIDPTGLALSLLCGWGQTCRAGNGGVAGGGNIEQWRSVLMEYWASDRSRVNFGENDLGFIFNLFAGALSNPLYFRDSDILEIFDVFVFDASPDGSGPFDQGKEINTTPVARRFAAAIEGLAYPMNYFVGFSFGAMTINEYLYLNRNASLAFRASVLGVYLYAGPNLGRTSPFTISDYYPFAYVVARSSREWLPGLVQTGITCRFKVACYPTFEWRSEAYDPHYPELDGGVHLRGDGDATCGHHCVGVDLSRRDAAELFGR